MSRFDCCQQVKMNEKKQSQQLTTLSAHHQKRQQSLGVVTNQHMQPTNPLNSSQTAAGINGMLQNYKSNNFMQMTGGGPGSSGPGGSLSSGGGSENRGGAAAAFIRNSYGNGSRMKKGSGNDSMNFEAINSTILAGGVGPALQGNNFSQLEQPLQLIPTSSHAANYSQLKKQDIGKKIKVMRNHGSSSSGVPVSNHQAALVVPSQQMALQTQLGNISNITTNMRQQQSPTNMACNSPPQQHQQFKGQMNHRGSLIQQQTTPSTNLNSTLGGINNMNNQNNANTASLKSARRYQPMNTSQQKNPPQQQTPGASGGLVVNSSSSAGVVITMKGGEANNIMGTQLSPQNLSMQFQNQMNTPSNQTLNIQQFKQQVANQKINLSLERPITNNDLIMQSPNSSDTSSINSLNQTVRVRIGGPLPKGILNSNQSTSSETSGVHPNHFYQSSSLNRAEINNSGISNSLFQQQPLQFHNLHNLNPQFHNQNQQQNTSNSNFGSLDYSEVAMSSRRGYNESTNAIIMGTGNSNNDLFLSSQAQQQQQHNSSNVKRNNFLSLLNNQMDDNQANQEMMLKSPESQSQPNAPSLRKITLNQRIMQKNMARVSGSNQGTIPQQQQQSLDPHEDQAHQVQQQQPIRYKKFQGIANQNSAIKNSNGGVQNQQQRDSSTTSSVTNSSDQQPMINVARIQQAIQNIYKNQRKNSLHNSQQPQITNAIPPQQQYIQQPSFSQEGHPVSGQGGLEGKSASQLKKKQIKVKQSYGTTGTLNMMESMKMSMNTQPTNASSDQQNMKINMSGGGNVPQLNLTNISQETNPNNQAIGTQNSATSPLNVKQHIHQGQIASSSRQMRQNQRSKINMAGGPQETARGSISMNPGDLTNRGQAAPHPNQSDQGYNSLISHRETAIQRTLTSARQESQLRQQTTQLVGQSSTDSLHKGAEEIQFPVAPQKALKLLKSQLTAYEMQEILDYPQIYYIGSGCQKIKGSLQSEYNFGYDDNKGNYKIVMKDHIGYRYEIQQFLGKGSFGIAVKCFDHKRKEQVALKVIKNKKKYYYQAGVELKILQYLKENDPDDTMNIIHMKDYVIFRKHLCISFELMSINLYDFLKLNDFQGLTLGLIRRFAIQLLYALKYLKENEVIHCDLKPENILLKDPTKSGIKIIDFGSSCFQDEKVYTYIQSRFYRAPEIILGISYTTAIDMWSFGCIMAEFCIGYPLFPGEDEMEQLAMMMELCGTPSNEVLKNSQRKKKFFGDDNTPILVPNQRGKVRKPGTKRLIDILDSEDASFVDFVDRCLKWDPNQRLTPDEALRHAWILEGLPPKVLIHHQKLHNIPTQELPPHIRELRQQYILQEQKAQQQQQVVGAPVPQPMVVQQQQFRSEPRKGQQTNIIGGNSAGNNNSAVIKRMSNQQLLFNVESGNNGIGVSGGAMPSQSDNHLQGTQLLQQQQQQHHQQLQAQQVSLLNQSLESSQTAPGAGVGGGNLISPRTKKIVMNSQEAAHKNHLILKTTSNNLVNNLQGSMENKSLENTLRNRKIILQSGLKRASDLAAAQQIQANQQQQVVLGNTNNGTGGGGTSGVSTSLTRKQIIFANNNQSSTASNISNAISDL